MDTTHERSTTYRLGIGICLVVFVLFAAFAFFEPTMAADFGLSEAAEGTDLPQSSIPAIVGNIISVALGLVGVAFLLLMLYGGFLWMTARGNTETVEKAKTTITSAIIGIIIVASAYAITSFIISQVGGEESPESGSSSWVEDASDFVRIPAAHAQGLGQELLEQTGLGGDGAEDAGERLPVIVGNIIRAILSLLGIIFVVLMVYAGFLWMTARGESDRVEQAKDTIKNAVIGIILVVLAYAITGFVVSAVMQAGGN